MKSHKLSIICDVINSSMNIEEHCQILMISKKINVLKKKIILFNVKFEFIFFKNIPKASA